MKCPWKLVLLLVGVCLVVQYMLNRFIHKLLQSQCQDVRQFQQEPNEDHILKSPNATSPPRRHILILSQARSGSSFTGQLFNQNPNVFYMFEPLYHVKYTFSSYSKWKPPSRVEQLVNTDLLLNLFSCDLHSLEAYIQPEPRDHLTASLFRRSDSHALCTPPVAQNKHECQGTLNLTLASAACQSRSHVSIKTIRMRDVRRLRLMTEDPQFDLRIVHLVRDPRAMLASCMTSFVEFGPWKTWNNTGRRPQSLDLTSMIEKCRDTEESVSAALRKPAWLRGRYLLVRYEDLALNPTDKAKEIYQFLDVEIDANVLRWISRNTNDSSSTHLYSTTRDARSTAESWRRSLAFDIVQTVQGLCANTMALLGYTPVESEEELRKTTKTLVEPMNFK